MLGKNKKEIYLNNYENISLNVIQKYVFGLFKDWFMYIVITNNCKDNVSNHIGKYF